MNREEELSERLLQWEELRSQGHYISAEDLCRDRPELIPELQRRIGALRALGAFVDAPQNLGPESDRDSLVDTKEGLSDDASSLGLSGYESCENKTQSIESSTDKAILTTRSTYQILRAHAKGGLGEVLIARDEQLGREVALKVIRRPFDQDTMRRRRFLREAEITSRLEHPGIVPIHGFGQDADGRLCYAMRKIGGETLQLAIERFHRNRNEAKERQQGMLEQRQLLGRFVSVCNAIAYAHSQGVIHRDIKPANIMLGRFGETLVVDWGLAKDTKLQPKSSNEEVTDGLPNEFDLTDSKQNDTQNDLDQLTIDGTAIGTPAFMSPEQSRGRWEAVGPSSDIYSLGVTLYVLLTGRVPFGGKHIVELNQRRASGDFVLPRRIDPEISPPLESICLKAMALRPEGRYETALQLASDIEKWMADEPVSAHSDSLAQRARRWMRHHRLLVSTSLASGIVAMLGLVGFLVHYSWKNEELRIAYRDEGIARTEAQANATLANENARLAEQQSELALRSLQSVTLDIQRQLRNVPAAHRVRERLLDTAMRGLGDVATKLQQRPVVNETLIVAHRDLGDIYLEVGSESGSGGIEKAQGHFQRALEIAQQLADAAPTDRKAQKELAKCHERLGDVAVRAGTTSLAHEHFQNAKVIHQKLCDESPDDEASHLGLAVSLSKIGELAMKGENIQSAFENYTAALDLRLKHSSSIDDAVQRELAITHNKVGFVMQRMGETKSAIESFERGLSITMVLAEKNKDDSLAQRDLSASYAYLGHAHAARGDNARAVDFLKKSTSIDGQQAVADPHNVLAQRGLMQSLGTMADLTAKMGTPDDALSLVEDMVEIAERLVAVDPNDSRAKRDLALAYTRLADLHLASSRIEEAIVFNEKSLAIRKQRAIDDPKDSRGRSDVAVGLTGLGDTYLAAKRTDEALAIYREAIALHELRVKSNPTDSLAQQNLAAYLQRIGVACKRSGLLEESKEHYVQALAVAETLVSDHSDNIIFQRLKITIQHSLGMLEQARGNFTEAYEWFDKGLVLSRDLTESGKFVGEDATWVEYIEEAIRQCREEQRAKQ
jgi:eukaryotic-like serine/threonine-protein kinase